MDATVERRHQLDRARCEQEPADDESAFEILFEWQERRSESEQDDEQPCASDQIFTAGVGQFSLRPEPNPIVTVPVPPKCRCRRANG